MKWNDLRDESCPVARGLSVIGDRWTMLVLRDCFLGVRRFDDIQKRLGVTRHVLADRLRKLEEDGVLERRQYQERPPRFEYRLTDKGKALHPVLMTLIHWSDTWVPAAKGDGPVMLNRDTGAPVQPLLIDATTQQPLTHRSVRRVERDATMPRK
mgnify:CR=1 FL=1